QDHVVRRIRRRLPAHGRGTQAGAHAFGRLHAVLRADRRPDRHYRRGSREDILLRQMGFELAPTARVAGYRLEAHDNVGSTNALALERATAEAADRLWVVSKRQESGRGRRGRTWATEEGNLAASLLLVAPSP